MAVSQRFEPFGGLLVGTSVPCSRRLNGPWGRGLGRRRSGGGDGGGDGDLDGRSVGVGGCRVLAVHDS